jgi:MFS family permease
MTTIVPARLRGLPRDAYLVLAARGVDALLQDLLVVALVLRVQASGAGPMANAYLMIALSVPAVATMHWAGWVADRVDSRAILTVGIAVQLVACMALAMPWAVNAGWVLYGGCVMFMGGFSFVGPVWMTLVPTIVGDDRVQQMAGAQMMITSLAAPIGGALAGFLVGAIGGQPVPAICAGAFVAVLVLARLIEARRHAGAEPGADRERQSERSGGFALIFGDRVLAGVLIGILFMVLVMSGINVVEVYLVRGDLGATPAQYGLTGVFGAVGTFVASFFVARLGTDRCRVWGIVLGFSGCGLVCAVMSQLNSIAMLFAVLTLLGFANSVANGAFGPLFLLRAKDAQRGQVMATLNGLLNAASVIALLVGGVAGVWLGPRLTYLVAGLLMLATMAVMGAVVIPATRPEHSAPR